MSTVCVNSEIGPLEAVLIHRPGPEVERMSPQAAHDALFDDIIHPARAAAEHDQLSAALAQFATVYELGDLLVEVLAQPEACAELVHGLCALYGCPERANELLALPAAPLAHQLLVGTPQHPTTLTAFLADEPFALPPMYNFYFTRDAAMCVHDRVIVGAMANRARRGEALVMRALFAHHPALRASGFYLDGSAPHPPDVAVEGGDVLVLREDLILIGTGERTTPAGIDVLLRAFAQAGRVRHVVVQPIPARRSTIHFDMVFTMVDRDLCVIHEPVILGLERQPPILFELRADGPPRIRRHHDLLGLLAELGLPLTPILTGGASPLMQAREQWQKGTNFFAMAPGKVIGYSRNEQSYRELEAHGFRVVAGSDVLAGRIDLTASGRVAVAMQGAELSRGGGGCRCMTLPIRRKKAG